jgi:hypothetical protein
MYVTDVKTTKANRWCLHIKDFASKNGMTYRDAMRSDACKASYKTPESPEVPKAPEVVPEVPEIEPLAPEVPELPIPKLERTELIQPMAVKKQRQKHRTVLVPT